MKKNWYKFILLIVGEETWASPITPMSQLVSNDIIEAVPDLPSLVVGLSYYNGHIFTVLDAAKFLNIRHQQSGAKQCLLFNVMDDYYAWLVDAVTETIRVDKIFIDRKKKTFKKYIKVKTEKIYILDTDELWLKLNIHEY